MSAILDAGKIQHPRKECAPLAVGLGWDADGAIYQEKLDGVFMTRTVPRDSVLVGEQMRSGEFIAWDCAGYEGQDVRGWDLCSRLAIRGELCRQFDVRQVESSPNGGELLERVLARGGEGIVRKLPHATYYDAMTACKRLQMWRCVVTALNYGSGAAKISDVTTGEDRGTVPLRNRVGQCRVGSIVKVEGETVSDRGLILKPRPCKDTATSWLIQF